MMRYLRRLLIMKITIIALLLVQLALTAYDWTNAEHVIEAAINERIITGCVLGIATNNATLFKKAYGTIGPKYGFYSPPVTVDMKFDLGYLTEPIGINAALMEGYDQGKYNTTSRVGNLFFDFSNNGKAYITLQNLLEHNSGTRLST
jgi:CubicO group peptidase (beta-lactamase class C family)